MLIRERRNDLQTLLPGDHFTEERPSARRKLIQGRHVCSTRRSSISLPITVLSTLRLVVGSSIQVSLIVGITVFHDACKATCTTDCELRSGVTGVCLAPSRGFGFETDLLSL
jgi:hypothetical protein